MGYIYRKKRKLPDGTIKEDRIWWLKFYDNGKEIRQSSQTHDYNAAKRKLKELEGKIAEGKPLPNNRLLFGELLDDVIRDYQSRRRKSMSTTVQRIEKNVRPPLGHLKVKDISNSVIRNYLNQRINAGAKPATVNRELCIISKAFAIADVPYRPKIELLEESNVRAGFVTNAQMDAIENNLPDCLRSLVRFLYITGWRRSEGFKLEWKNVGFDKGFLVLEHGTTKNNEGRLFPITAELRTLLTNQREYVRGLERKFSRIISHVFVHPNGEPVLCIRRSWKSACKKAGLGHVLVHDLRRSAIMNFYQNGIDQQTGMLLSGHKTANVYRRYNIPIIDTLREAAKKLDAASGLNVTGTISGTIEAFGKNR